jgi:SEFIR domain
MPRVLVSYAHERAIDGHRGRALDLAQSLRIRGVEAIIDQFLEHDPPFWPRWMTTEVRAADYVLCLASPAYKERVEGRGDPRVGRGARWEGVIITEQLYEEFSTAEKKFIAVVLEKCSPEDIPDILLPIGRSYYYWPQDDEDLYRRLTGQPRVLPAPLGEIIPLPSEEIRR